VRLLVTAGRGPRECQLVVTRLADILVEEATATGLTVTRDDEVAGSVADGARSIELVVVGPAAAVWASQVTGTVCWVAPSPLRPHHRRHNWFVDVTPAVGRSELAPAEPNPRQVTVEAIRAGGPGGQRRNKVATGVRATCGATGRVVVATNERSFVANKRAALERLAALDAADIDAGRAAADHDRWQQHNDTSRGGAQRIIRRPLL